MLRITLALLWFYLTYLTYSTLSVAQGDSTALLQTHDMTFVTALLYHCTAAVVYAMGSIVLMIMYATTYLFNLDRLAGVSVTDEF